MKGLLVTWGLPVAQWLRLHLPMQGHRLDGSLVRELRYYRPSGVAQIFFKKLQRDSPYSPNQNTLE